ncbi:branched-chain amino acid transport system II carrier protein [uncultured Acidaminococcus sp.]|uniref:branched-chain amino acid transport system II carrier protein n=1 Tax=uncultured Acidaminococcus sp. TaxID=352152 RepID=UPI0026DC5FA9|nr:branched-chain amino acid transport system II carrier protein [uncultured Acidaminococcus sp.]
MNNHKLTSAEYLFVGSMLFGMLFGAGNLIFPVHMGQLAGAHFWSANIGFIATGVLMPFLALIAFGLSGSGSLEELAGNVHPVFARVFTVMLYLTIGPAFALPRTATVSYQIGIVPFVGENQTLILAGFTFLFMAVALLFSLKPSKLVVYIGKFLNPVFLAFLAILVAVALVHPMGSIAGSLPQGDYVDHAFLTGFKEGYNTMDVLAMLAFSVVVIDTLKNLGVRDVATISVDLLKVGVIVVFLMSLIYTLITWLGTSSLGQLAVSANGGIALAQIAHGYFGPVGGMLLAAIVTFACLKTAIGLITACANTFQELFPGTLGYKAYCVVFAGVSFLIGNVGLTQIIVLAVPILMFLYPMAITLILSSFASALLGKDRRLYRWPMVLAGVAAFGDALSVLPKGLQGTAPVQALLGCYHQLPLFSLGMSWLLPTLAALAAAAAAVKLSGGKQ